MNYIVIILTYIHTYIKELTNHTHTHTHTHTYIYIHILTIQYCYILTINNLIC
jgi:hypothetical protein